MSWIESFRFPIKSFSLPFFNPIQCTHVHIRSSQKIMFASPSHELKYSSSPRSKSSNLNRIFRRIMVNIKRKQKRKNSVICTKFQRKEKEILDYKLPSTKECSSADLSVLRKYLTAKLEDGEFAMRVKYHLVTPSEDLIYAFAATSVSRKSRERVLTDHYCLSVLHANRKIFACGKQNCNIPITVWENSFKCRECGIDFHEKCTKNHVCIEYAISSESESDECSIRSG